MKVGENMRIPEPVLAEDFYMVKRIGGDVTLPVPRTRFEKLLYIYAGGTIERPTPKTVEERFLDYITGGASELPVPKTRLQSYMYNVANPSNKIPVVPPKTRFECYWFVMAEVNNVISDELPVEFTSVDDFLFVYTIWGNSEQDGTPSPENPVEIQSVGDLVIDEIDPNYGKYKIPVTVSGENGREITTVIYLDEPLRKIGDYADYIDFEKRQIIRRVKKLVLTGEENWGRYQSYAHGFQITVSPPNLLLYNAVTISSSHYPGYSGLWNLSSNIGIFAADASRIRIKDINFDTVFDFKSYLAIQYEQGTPVTASYVLAEPITELIELPKIPTFASANAIDVDTTVKPSKIESVDGFLLDYTISGNSEQDGTPSPENPVDVQSVGDLVIDEIDPNYGKYKIPVTVSGENGREITTVIYLDEPLRKIGAYADYVDFEKRQIIRHIKKLVLTGEENWRQYQTHAHGFQFTVSPPNLLLHNAVTISSSHYPGYSGLWNLSSNIGIFAADASRIRIKDINFDTVFDFKSYLAIQYEQGTPVTASYVLAEPITELIELPKIPTFAGTNAIDVDTTVKPSKIELVTRTE